LNNAKFFEHFSPFSNLINLLNTNTKKRQSSFFSNKNHY
jgi:hypothetical protein